MIENYRDYARSIALHFWRAPVEQEDTIGVAMVALVCAVSEVDPDRLRTLPGLLWRCVRDAVISWERKEFRRLRVFRGQLAPDLPGDVIPFEIAQAARQAAERLRSAVAALPAADRAVLQALYWEGRTQTETGRVLSISQARVAQRRSRAIDHLRAAL